ncbi:putative ATP binding protein [Hibiscus syriacus]|uniref:ATP binding protein n=1 Tax=Hibiscus syriacus TaxID=106335 RepID=A0A6A3B7M2_HIBSY|nr:putative ATP binding protein [Hibiscus syriacus]
MLLFKQGWKWLESQKHVYSKAEQMLLGVVTNGVVDGEALAYGLQWVCWFLPVFEVGFGLSKILFGERVPVMYPIGSSFVACHDVELFPQLDFHVLLALCAFDLVYVVPSILSMKQMIWSHLFQGAAGAAVQYLGYTPGLFIVGLFVILVLWMYANFWITGTLFIVGGYLFSLCHTRLIVLIAIVYAVYCVKVRVGWHGVFLSINLAFLSNDVVDYLLQCFDNASENSHFEDQKEPKSVMEDDLPGRCEYSIPTDEPKKVHQCKSSSKSATTSVINQNELTTKRVVKEETSSTDEMKRILNSTDHYEALGFPRQVKIDAGILKKEYRKKAMLVHPDRNMGSPLASEFFKKLQCAYEVLSDSMKKRDYDEQLRKEESKTRSVCQKSHSSTRQIIAPKNRGVYSAPSAVIRTYGCAQTGTRPRLGGVRIVVNIIKPKMEMDGLSTKVPWRSLGLRRWKYHELLSAPRARSSMFRNGLYVRRYKPQQAVSGNIEALPVLIGNRSCSATTGSAKKCNYFKRCMLRIELVPNNITFLLSSYGLQSCWPLGQRVILLRDDEEIQRRTWDFTLCHRC